ncbi:restriction endonuclease subunit S [Leucobacter salsicius]|uniref:restriction endonuclease subunit S n=1 Tax=Leucobacter salsicius TaxID=664638 RepID=UPI0003449AE0|nr:restriction endonuclease subunit S [Leucobacter salsicius]
MSRIDDLIAKHCPDGVRHVALSEVAEYSPTRVDAADLDGTSFVGVDNLVAEKGGRINASYLPNTTRLTAYESGDILLGNIRPYLKKVWLASNSGGCSGDVLAIRIKQAAQTSLTPEFLYYALSSDGFFAYNMQHAKGAKMPRGNKAAILNYVIPVPPLEVQRAIVEVLDTFSKLEAELEAELEARKQQYEHYRTELLASVESAEWSTLGAISDRVSSGATPKAGKREFYEGGTIPWLRTGEVTFGEVWDTEVKITEHALETTGVSWIKENCVIIAISGATAARSAINKIPLTTNQHCCNLQINEDRADYRFVFYWVSSKYEELKSRGRGARADLNAKLIKDFAIPVPPLDEQRRIVTILDSFDSLVNDLSIGLPAELAARRQQYEYYRDKLLTFKELKAAA